MMQEMSLAAYVNQYLLLSPKSKALRLQQAWFHQHHESNYQDLAKGDIEKKEIRSRQKHQSNSLALSMGKEQQMPCYHYELMQTSA